MILSYSSTEFIRFNANIAFLSMSKKIVLRRTALGGTSLQFPFSFPTFSSVTYACSQASPSQYKYRLHATFENISRHDF